MRRLTPVAVALVVAAVIAGLAAQYWLASPIGTLAAEEMYEVREGASLKSVAGDLA